MMNWNKNIAKLTLPTPFPIGDVNVYVVKGDALTLFDTGVKTKESKEALVYQLAELGLCITDIEQVVLTHHHPDHAAALDFFEQDVPVYGHPNNQRWLDWSDEFIERHNHFFLHYAQQLGVAEELIEQMFHKYKERECLSKRTLSQTLLEGDDIPGLPDWKAVETLGHAQSHLSFYRETDGVFIGGDLLMARVSPNPIMEPPLVAGGERPKSLLQHNQSLKKVVEMPISLVQSGHGADIIDVKELVDSRMARQHNRAMQIKKMLEQQPLTAFDICQQVFPKVYQHQIGLTMSETIGQLDYLQDLGEIYSETESGLIRFLVR